MRRRQFYLANGFVSGNRAIRNFFSKRRYPHNVALTTYFWLMVSSPKNTTKRFICLVHNFPIYARTARSGNRVYVSSGKVAERKTKEIEIKSILCIPHEIRSWDGCGAKIEIKSILFKSRLGVDGIGMESAIHRNRNAI
ncbi:hypothetical protein LXL04_028905 [Taraxacum kok-saghyz]